MDDFYTRLARELKKSEKDIWVNTRERSGYFPAKKMPGM